MMRKLKAGKIPKTSPCTMTHPLKMMMIVRRRWIVQNGLAGATCLQRRRMLLNDGQPTHPSLSVLPCMQEKKLMPIELTNILNARRGKIEFYAKMNLSLGFIPYG